MPIIKQINRQRIQYKQGGFVLIMALVLLAVMTLIGVSSMNSSNMELKATANARQHQKAFTDVYSLLEYTFSSGAVTTDGTPIDYQTTAAAVQVVDPPAAAAAAGNLSQASINYIGCSSGVGSSLLAGKGVSYNFYNIVASGFSAASLVAAQQNRGARYPAASCGL